VVLKLLYHIVLRLYYVLLLILRPLNRKAALFCKGRKGLLERISSSIDTKDPVTWFHCASVGEFEQARPLIELYKERNPEHKILLTFFSPSGYELRKNYPLADWVFYLPLDIKSNAVRFLDAVNPRVAIFIKYEYWFNYLFELKKRRIPAYVASAIFHPGQRFFKWYGSIFRKMLRTFSHIFVQDEKSAELLRSVGIKCVTVSGDTRFDRVVSVAGACAGISSIEIFASGKRCWIAGSTWQADEEIISSIYPDLPGHKLIIAPHEVGERHIQRLISLFPERKILRYSNIKDRDLTDSFKKELENSDILIVDTIGILSIIYRYGSFAYIGGGFGAGIHNVLEAAVYGTPVIIGPKYRRFKEANDLVNNGGVVSVNGKMGLKEAVTLYLSNPSICASKGEICKSYVDNNTGASVKVLTTIQRWLQ
jgi:3-deoxy-D-manno-octulosonic-acid transferase